MKRRRRWLGVGALLFLVGLSVACGGDVEVVGVEVSGAESDAGTALIPFDPDSFPLDAVAEPVVAVCVPSQAVVGTYHCRTEATGETADPCFRLADGDLLCEPNPVTEDYAMRVRPADPLPALSAPPDDADPFFLELEGAVTTCTLRTGIEPVVVAGVAARYDCDAPYTYVMGFEKSSPVWEAALYVLDPATGGSSSGKVPVNVMRAWTVR